MIRTPHNSATSSPWSLSLRLLAVASLIATGCAASSDPRPGTTGGKGGGGNGGNGGNGGVTASGGSTGTGGGGSNGQNTGGNSSGTGGSGAGGSGAGGSGGGTDGPASGTGGSGTGGSGTGGTTGSGGMPGTVFDPPCSDQVDSVAPSVDPPGGLAANTVPMFVLLGFDDNAFADGIHWTLDYLRGRKHPDGSAARATYFITGGFASEFFNPAGGQSKEDVINAWKRIKNDGHELANHSWSHSMQLAGSDKATWLAEMNKTNDVLANVVGAERCKLVGFRTPFLGFSQNTFDALKETGMRYDTSIEFGYDWWQPPGSDKGYGPGTAEAGKHYYWPFTMDRPFLSGFATKGVMVQSPGLWQFPVYTFNKVTGETAMTVTGFDFNLWNKAQQDAMFSFTETLKQSLDQRLAGNRSPFAIGAHSDVYAQFNESANTTWNKFDYQVRRKALADFIDYALTKPEVRFVTYRQLIAWMRSPRAL